MMLTLETARRMLLSSCHKFDSVTHRLQCGCEGRQCSASNHGPNEKSTSPNSCSFAFQPFASPASMSLRKHDLAMT